MEPLFIVGGIAALALLLRRESPAAASPALAPSIRAAGGLQLGDVSRLRGAFAPALAVDGAFQSRAEASGASGASGYRGGTSPPRLRSFGGVGQFHGRKARADGLPLAMARAEVPWWPGNWLGTDSLNGGVRPNIATIGGTVDAARWDTDRGVNDADRWWGPALLFDSDDVAWVCELGAFQPWQIGDPQFLSVGFGAVAIMAIDAEHQLTGATAEWSRAAWELDAPRIVNRGGVWKLEGFGAAELAEGQRLNQRTLAVQWAQRVNGFGPDAQGVNPWSDGTTTRSVWKPLIDRAKQMIGRDAGPGYVAGERVFDPAIWNR